MAGALKKTYRMIASMARVNMILLGGGIAYLVAGGRLNADRAREVVSLVMGGGDADQKASSANDQKETGSEPEPSVVTREQEQEADEIRWRNADRYRARIEQRLKFINTVSMDVDRKREKFEHLQAAARQEREERLRKAGQPGYQKVLDIIAALKPKAALQQIMSMSDADAAQVLFQLDNRKVKKVFEAAKTSVETTKLTTVRQLIRDMQPDVLDTATVAGGGA